MFFISFTVITTAFFTVFLSAENRLEVQHNSQNGNERLMFNKILKNEGQSSPLFELFMDLWPKYKKTFHLKYDTLEEEEMRFDNFAVHYCALSLLQVQLQFNPALLPFQPAFTQYAVLTEEEKRRTLYKNMNAAQIKQMFPEQFRPPSGMATLENQAY